MTLVRRPARGCPARRCPSRSACWRSPPGWRSPRRWAAGPGGPRGRRGPGCRGASVTAVHNAPASRRRRGRSSRPTRAANVCSAGPPAARRRRNASPSWTTVGSRSPAALSTTWPTQPSISASAVSRRARLAFCCGVSSGVKMPSSAIACIDSGSARVDAAHRLLDGVAVDGDAVRVRLDRAQHVRAQPRDVLEQPLVGRLAQGHVQAHLVLGDLQALAVRLDVGRDERGGAGRSERKADVAGREHLGRELAERLAELAAEERAAERGDHRLHRPELGAGLLGNEVAHRAHHAPGDRVAELLPHVEGVVDPFVAVPRGGDCGCRWAARTPGRARGRRAAGTPRRGSARRWSPPGRRTWRVGWRPPGAPGPSSPGRCPAQRTSAAAAP